MERISRRKFWMLFTLLSGIAAVLVGNNWLFQDSACPHLQESLLYTFAGIGTLAGLLYSLLTQNDSPVTKLISVLGQFVLILVVVSISGAILSRQPSVQAVFCNPSVCEKASLAEALRETGRLDGAEDVARACNTDISMSLIPQECASECSRELSLVLFEKAGITIAQIPPSSGDSRNALCESARADLDEAYGLAVQYDYTDLASSIQERQTRLGERCTLTPIPTPTIQVEVIRSQRSSSLVFADVRVLENDQFLPGLQISDFSLMVNRQSVSFTLEERRADDPICLVAVVDDSGSIYEGIGNIRAAIQKLNDLRKPGDELGMVIFSDRDQIRIAQSPAADPLNSNAVQGAGQLTALWDGILEGLNAAQSCTSDSRYLLILTDGRDNDSHHLEGDDPTRARTIARLAAEQGVDICTVGVTDKVDEESLELVSAGCGFYYAENFETVANQFQNLFGYVRDFYRVSFLPEFIPVGSQVILRVRQSQEVPIDFNP
ncbi:MAG: vWA domain-containing protein [Chloroflexota bacterium]